MHTFFSTCLDERIRACAISGYFSTFRNSILAMSHCACNFVPGLAEFGEMYDLACLIAPRPVFIESGNYDPIFRSRPLNQVSKNYAADTMFLMPGIRFLMIFSRANTVLMVIRHTPFFNRIFNNS